MEHNTIFENGIRSQDNLIFFGNGRRTHFLKMEDDLNFFENGRQPHFFLNGIQHQFF